MRVILSLVIVAIVWVVFLKAVIVSGEIKLEKAEKALAKGNWEEVDYQYRNARKRFAFYLKIFIHLPEEISLEPVSEVEKLHKKADSGVKKVIRHYRDVARKNKEIEAEKARIRENYRKRLICGEVAPTEDEYVYTPDEVQVDEVRSDKVETGKAPVRSSVEAGEGKWLDDIDSFDDDDDARTKAASAGSDLDPDQEEGTVRSNQPSWITK